MSMLNAIENGSCFGHVCLKGKNKGKLSQSKGHAAEACEEAHGIRPAGYVCRHLCVNDSQATKRGEDGFVCVNPEHIEWSTISQNTLDAGHSISEAKKGKTTFSDTARKAMSDAHKGKTRSDDHRKAMSDAHKESWKRRKAEKAVAAELH